jgi:hypothetical protein
MSVPPSATSSTGRCFGASARIGRRSHVPRNQEGRHRTEEMLLAICDKKPAKENAAKKTTPKPQRKH